MSEPILEVRDLGKSFGRRKRGPAVRPALQNISFTVGAGEVLGIVGESGSGKSTLARCIARLIEPSTGSVTLDGQDMQVLRGRTLRQMRQRVQLVFQDPYSSLDPRMTVGEIIAEGMRIHGLYPVRADRDARVRELMELVGLRPDHIDRRPAAFSGGERQRIGIARALAVDPVLLICDEPVASLDVSIQAQILNLLRRLKEELSLTILFIAHDLATVRFLCDRVMVLKDGEMQEIGLRGDVYERPTAAYTKELLAAAPTPDPEAERAKRARRTQDGGAA